MIIDQHILFDASITWWLITLCIVIIILPLFLNMQTKATNAVSATWIQVGVAIIILFFLSSRKPFEETYSLIDKSTVGLLSNGRDATTIDFDGEYYRVDDIASLSNLEHENSELIFIQRVGTLLSTKKFVVKESGFFNEIKRLPTKTGVWDLYIYLLITVFWCVVVNLASKAEIDGYSPKIYASTIGWTIGLVLVTSGIYSASIENSEKGNTKWMLLKDYEYELTVGEGFFMVNHKVGEPHRYNNEVLGPEVNPKAIKKENINLYIRFDKYNLSQTIDYNNYRFKIRAKENKMHIRPLRSKLSVRVEDLGVMSMKFTRLLDMVDIDRGWTINGGDSVHFYKDGIRDGLIMSISGIDYKELEKHHKQKLDQYPQTEYHEIDTSEVEINAKDSIF